MKKIIVNDGACIGCGACVAIDPEHFAFNDEGLSHAISNDNLDAKELKNAIETCPTSAISIGSCDGECSNENTCNCQEDGECECEDCHCGDECNCHDENEKTV